IDAIVEGAMRLQAQKYHVYYTLNPTAHAPTNRFVTTGAATEDKDIVKRTRMLIDIDPERPSGTSSTREEYTYAARIGWTIYKTLMEEFGFPDCLIVHSGNGFHLIHDLDVPNTPEMAELIHNCLRALKQQ